MSTKFTERSPLKAALSAPAPSTKKPASSPRSHHRREATVDTPKILDKLKRLVMDEDESEHILLQVIQDLRSEDWHLIRNLAEWEAGWHELAFLEPRQVFIYEEIPIKFSRGRQVDTVKKFLYFFLHLLMKNELHHTMYSDKMRLTPRNSRVDWIENSMDLVSGGPPKDCLRFTLILLPVRSRLDFQIKKKWPAELFSPAAIIPEEDDDSGQEYGDADSSSSDYPEDPLAPPAPLPSLPPYPIQPLVKRGNTMELIDIILKKTRLDKNALDAKRLLDTPARATSENEVLKKK